MRVIKTQVFPYSELSDAAKSKARDWYRDSGFDYEWWDGDYEDFFTIADLIGLDIRPNKRDDTSNNIFFSGFSQQGDGACFVGRYNGTVGALAQVMGHAPIDTELHRIAQELDEAQASVEHGLNAVITMSGGYCHRYSMDFDFRWVLTDEDQERLQVAEAESRITEALRDLAQWMYRQLEETWEAINEPEAIAETIEANEWTFTADGKRFG
jgi:hypothetical protein